MVDDRAAPADAGATGGGGMDIGRSLCDRRGRFERAQIGALTKPEGCGIIEPMKNSFTVL